MLRKALSKVSSALYKAHLYVNRQAKKNPNFKPYILNCSPTQSNITVVHVNGNFIIGGSSQLIVDLVERTSDIYTHHIVVPDYPEPLPYQPVSIQKFSIAQMQQLFVYLKEVKPALVHIHYWTREGYRFSELGLWYAAVFEICQALNLKIIQNINVPTVPFRSSAVVHNVFVSRYVMDNYNNVGEVLSSVIYPGSNFQHFQNAETIDTLPGTSIGMVYRLDHDKLNPDAIEVFIAVSKKKPDVTCYIIGEGAYYRHYKKRVREENLDRNIIFTGFVSYRSLPQYYKKMQVFVAPVHNESFGQVTPFAMSMGLCIAGYDIGALSEIVGSKDTLVPYGKIDVLADVIIELLNNPDKRAVLGMKNRIRAHALFSVEAMIDQYKKLYATIAGC